MFIVLKQWHRSFMLIFIIIVGVSAKSARLENS